LEEFVIGTAIALLVSLVVFPCFATIDIENRVNYCLANLQNMQKWSVQAFLCADPTNAQVHLARASTLEQMIRSTMNMMPPRLIEARFEPSRCLQRLFNWKRRYLIDLTVQGEFSCSSTGIIDRDFFSFEEQEDLISSLMFHVCALSLMVKQCQFNEYHDHFIKELEVNLLQVVLCQSKIVSALTTFPSPDRTVFSGYLTALEQAASTLRQAYIGARLRRIEHVLESGTTIQSEDHLSHAFFLFQLNAIGRLLTRATNVGADRSILQEIRDGLKRKQGKKRRTFKQWLKPQWPRALTAVKSMTIVGVGSIFVMVPRLAKTFENGQWILIALCMTQGDTVGGALTTMKMRLIGTLFGNVSFDVFLNAKSLFCRCNVGLRDLYNCSRSRLSHVGHARAMDNAVWILETITQLELCCHCRCLHACSDQSRSHPLRKCCSRRQLRPSSNRRESSGNCHRHFPDHWHLSRVRH
jgi:hypothetical protein